jgi:hypothetical protein
MAMVILTKRRRFSARANVILVSSTMERRVGQPVAREPTTLLRRYARK